MKLPTDYTKLTSTERREVREQYALDQGNVCIYCDIYLDHLPADWVLNKEINWNLFPDGFLDHPIHLQHNHAPGMTEGAVHAYCNAVMWQYEGR